MFRVHVQKILFSNIFSEKELECSRKRNDGFNNDGWLFSTSHIALLGKTCWYNLYCFLQNLLLSMQLKSEVLFDKGSLIKILLSDEIIVNSKNCPRNILSILKNDFLCYIGYSVSTVYDHETPQRDFGLKWKYKE